MGSGQKENEVPEGLGRTTVTNLYKIEFVKSAEKAFLNLPAYEQQQIRKKVDALAHDPRPSGCKKLSGEDGLYRIRSGDYRVIYMIEDRVLLVLVVKIGHRRDVYRKR